MESMSCVPQAVLSTEDTVRDYKSLAAVERAFPSGSAQYKAASKRTRDDQPVHHFRGLIDHLATLTKNTVQPRGTLPTFDQLTVPTPFQRRVFELLEGHLTP